MRYLFVQILLVYLLFGFSIYTEANPFGSFRGLVVDSQTKEPLPFATLRLKSVEGTYIGSITDEEGTFNIPSIKEGDYEALISYIGYKECSTQIQIKDSSFYKFLLEPISTLLNEVVVTASESKGITSASKIDRTAMEHLQPSSFTDLLALLPGGKTRTPNMNSPNIIKLREVGLSSSDYNTTSLGTKFVIDGTPINTDAEMQFVKSEITNSFDDKTIINAGVDMRNISTDNIESVEIIRGIPSVEHGDLTSGVVIIERKQKATPLEARFKADQSSMLFSIGKGLSWNNQKKTFTADGGFLSSKSDPRNTLNNYKRINFSLRYQQKWDVVSGNHLRWNTSADYAGNIDANKNDPEILTQPEDKYKANYNSIQWQNKLRWSSSSKKAFKYLEANLSASFSADKIDRTRFVQLTRDMVVPTNREEGAYDAEILPYKYTANHIVDGKPLSLYANVKSEFFVQTGAIQHRLLGGANWTYTKNLGDGQVYDLKRPLNPLTTSNRPRPYKDIPASEQISLFVEDRLLYPIGSNTLLVQAGLRTNTLLNINKKYHLHGNIYIDPRINIQWKFPKINIMEKDLLINLSGGFGGLTKMPTLLQLYPEKFYMDFVQLNYWNANDDYKRMNLYTYIVDPTNYQLKPARNLKWEMRLGFDYDQNTLSITYFREKMNSGFRYLSTYAPYKYKEYDASGIDGKNLTAPPSLENMPYKEKTVLNGYGYTGNGSMTYKEGVEFQFSSKRFNVINTRLTINGAWFRSKYDNSIPVYRPVGDVVHNIPVSDLYVGLYENEDNYTREQFNTNFIIDTWLENIGVKLSETIECSWFQSSLNGQISGEPLKYMDTTGKVNPFTTADKNDAFKKMLIFNYNEGRFTKDTNPFYLYVNFKATKDFGKHVSISLFADKILDYVPSYTRLGLEVRRTALSPYFGMELNLRL